MGVRTRRNAVAVLPVLVGVLLLPAGCGADEDAPESTAAAPAAKAPPPRPEPPAVDACSLLTRGEAEATLGMPVGEPVRGDVPPVYSCTYQSADRLNNVQVNVTSYTDARQAHDAYLMAVKINSYKELDGLGDRAYQSPISDVNVLRGRFEMNVDVSLSIPKDAQVKKAREIAARAIDRLPK